MALKLEVRVHENLILPEELSCCTARLTVKLVACEQREKVYRQRGLSPKVGPESQGEELGMPKQEEANSKQEGGGGGETESR